MDKKRREYRIIEPGNPEAKINTVKELVGVLAITGAAVLDAISKRFGHNPDDITRPPSSRM